MTPIERGALPLGATENKEIDLPGKVALITGASRDIGAGIAKALAQEGVSIIGNYREKKKRADKIQQTISLLGVKSEFVQADITNEEGRNRLKQTLENSFGGKLDFLVLNASGKSTDINVTAANALIDQFLPLMPRHSTIVLMQSVPGHFEPQLDGLYVTPEFYRPIAKAKYKGEQSIRSRIKEFKEKGINFIVICPPEVPDTSNMKVFARYDPLISKKHTDISNMLGLPTTTTKERIGEKIAELLKRKDFPMGYTELFGNTIDARNILSAWYGDKAIYVDTLEIINEKSGIGRLIVTKEHTEGHFNEDVGISVFPGHKMIEASAQVLGLIALGGKITNDTMPLFQGIKGPIKFLKTVFPGDILRIQATITEATKRGFIGNVRILNQKEEAVVEINGLEAIIVKKEIAKRLMGVK